MGCGQVFALVARAPHERVVHHKFGGKGGCKERAVSSLSRRAHMHAYAPGGGRGHCVRERVPNQDTRTLRIELEVFTPCVQLVPPSRAHSPLSPPKERHVDLLSAPAHRRGLRAPRVPPRSPSRSPPPPHSTLSAAAALLYCTACRRPPPPPCSLASIAPPATRASCALCSGSRRVVANLGVSVRETRQ